MTLGEKDTFKKKKKENIRKKEEENISRKEKGDRERHEEREAVREMGRSGRGRTIVRERVRERNILRED